MTSRAWHADDGGELRVPVARPLLPTHEHLLPFLTEIDERRIYANGGPLLRRFETQLADHFGADPADVMVTTNGTSALTALLLEVAGGRSGLCVVPAWTFAATAAAVTAAGLSPWIVDVDAETQALDPDAVATLLAEHPEQVSAVVVVQPFGAPVDVASWDGFQEKTGVPVVIDAAAGFDSVVSSSLPAVVSLHATKALGIGEGGFVLGPLRIVRAVRKRINFGFDGTREAQVDSVNGKPSEYAAAVGLAALAAWPAARRSYQRVARAYVDGFSGSGVRTMLGYGEQWVSSTAIAILPDSTLANVEDRLARDGIASRRWWGDGLAAHRAYRHCLRTQLPATETLAAAVLGLPCWPDLADSEIRRIVELVRDGAGR